MRPVKNVTKPTIYKGASSGYIYTFQKYVPCPNHLPACGECPGRSEVIHIFDGITHTTAFCTQGIKSWRIE